MVKIVLAVGGVSVGIILIKLMLTIFVDDKSDSRKKFMATFI